MPDITFPSLAGGEIAPAYYGRTDQDAYFVSAKALYNYLASQTGPAVGRGGTGFIAGVKDNGERVLLVPFTFNELQAYIAEFGHKYIRIYRNRARQYEGGLAITDITEANPAVVTVPHALTRGRTVKITEVAGMTQVNGEHFLVEHVLGTGKNITAITKTNPVRVTLDTAHGFVGGEHVFAESIGGMTELNDRTFELVPATGQTFSIVNITQANPGVVRVSGEHGLTTGDFVFIENVSGMTQVNGLRFEITEVDGDEFSIGVNTTAYGAYIAPGTFKTVFITSGSTWQVPTDFDPDNNTIECIGGGGGGNASGGGGGAAYSKTNNLDLTPGATVSVNIGAAGIAAVVFPAAAATDGGDTWISNTGAAPMSAQQGCLAKGGRMGSTRTGGLAGDSIGNTKFSGGTGGTGATAGGGGAAGPHGAGGNAGNGTTGGGGGGGADGGGAGAAGGSSGGAGGTNRTGSGAGTGSSSGSGGNGSSGGAGGGSDNGSGSGGNGSFETLWTATVGGATAGPGSGAGGGVSGAGTAGLYGGGAGAWGAGRAGIIIVRYQPFPSSTGGTATEVLEDEFDLKNENGYRNATYTSGGTLKKVSTTSLSLKNLDGSALDASAYSNYTSGGLMEAIHEIESPYSVGDLFDADGLPRLQIAQSADFLFVACQGYHPRQMTRHGHADFEIEEFANEEGPFLDENEDEGATIYATGSVAVGSTITLNASQPLWETAHLGALWMLRVPDDSNSPRWASETAYSLNDEVVSNNLYYRCTDAGTSGFEAPSHDVGSAWDGPDTSAACKWQYIHNGRCVVRITAWASSSQVSAKVLTELPDGLVGASGASSRWAEGAWSDKQGYPRAVAIHEGRVIWGGTSEEPLALDVSSAFSFFNYNPIELDGTVTRATAFRRVLDGDNPIRWMRSTEKGLVIGTLAGEWVVTTEGVTQGFGPDTAVARQFSANGAAPIQPVRNGDSLLYAQRARKRVRDITFSIDQQKMVTSDRNLRSDHVAKPGIVAMVYAEEPYRIIWCVLGDGTIAGLTYNREPGAQVSAWHRHVIGGVFGDDGDAVVESAAVIPSPDASVDDLWLSIKRTIDGETKRYVEYLSQPLTEGEDISLGTFMDSFVTVEGTAMVNVPAGTLDHLIGEDVVVLADGVLIEGTVDTDGTLVDDLDTAADLIHVGLYKMKFVETVFIESAPGDSLNTKAKLKRVIKVQVEVVESTKLWCGTDEDYMDQMIFDEFYDGDGAPRRITGFVEESINDDFGRRKFVRLEQREPYPSVITSITPTIEVATE